MKGVNIFAEAFRRNAIRKLSMILLLLELTFAFYIQFISLNLVSAYHFSPAKLGIFMSFSGFIFAFTLGFLVRFVVKVVSEKTMITAGLGISISGYLLPLAIHSEWMQWTALVPIIVGIGLAYNALLAAFSNSASEKEQGWVMGVTGAVMAMAWILGAFCASLFFYLNPLLPFLMAAIFLMVGFVISVFLDKNKVHEKMSIQR